MHAEDVEDETDPKSKIASSSLSKVHPIMADECQEILKQIFEHDGDFLKTLFPLMQSTRCEPYDIFFMNVLPVVPPIWRPPNHVRDVLVEHPQTKSYHKVVDFNNELHYILIMKKTTEEVENLSPELKEEAEKILKLARGKQINEKIYYKWEELQNAINMVLDTDASLSKFGTDNAIGIKQLIEKKQGLIRMNMMGKRVNFACRTVITPDPYIEVDSIGIPEAFALKLTYPVPVTPWNVKQLRKMVQNGPDIHPGACYIETTNGSKRVIPKEAHKRDAMANTLLMPEKNEGIKFVHRHLLNGDIMLLNRQPTLHRPSIMAHKARILKGEKTFKLHYSNCKVRSLCLSFCCIIY